MSEIIVATGVAAVCADGVTRNDVLMKVIDGEVIYESSDGEHLCGDCCVTFIDKATFVAPMQYVALAIEQYRKQEA